MHGETVKLNNCTHLIILNH